jgi:tetratricopeptide (TPR) repeat protein
MRAPIRTFLYTLFTNLAFLTGFLPTSLLCAEAPAQTTSTPPAQTTPSDKAPQSDLVRQRAVDLYHQGKMVDAMPLFENLCTLYPRDNAMWEAWGMATLGYSATLPDADQRKKTRALARARLMKAKELGDNSNLLQSVLPNIPVDGGEGSFSASKEVNDVMQHAEADFSRGDYDKAKDGYLQALLLEPKNYDAALFMGDVYFKQHENGSAGEWFARAVEIDPNRETAYRYWGDALSAMGKSADAREKYIQAIVAEPYNTRALIGLNQWAQRTKTRLNWVRLQDKSKATPAANGGATLTIDNSTQKDDPGLGAWIAYSGDRIEWQKEKFKQEFPSAPQYRHTMREEVDALHLMVTVLTEQKDFEQREKDFDPALIQLVKIDRAGFLEPFALLNRGDKEIAQDYAPYREEHRDTIYRYFDEFVVPKAPQ